MLYKHSYYILFYFHPGADLLRVEVFWGEGNMVRADSAKSQFFNKKIQKITKCGQINIMNYTILVW